MSHRQRAIESFHLNRRAVWARSYARIVGSMREPSWILSETLLPLVGMFAYVFVYRALGAPREFESFAVLGGFAIWPRQPGAEPDNGKWWLGPPAAWAAEICSAETRNVCAVSLTPSLISTASSH